MTRTVAMRPTCHWRPRTPSEHRALCADITVDVWRNECLTWDWNEAVLATKLARLGAAILAGHEGRGPDIVVLQEVENAAVLERLRSEFLGAAGYEPGVLLEGQDTRGIDVAILSRLPPTGRPTLHPVTFADYPRGPRNDTRGILEAAFRLPSGRTVTVFAVHFPAPYHPPAMRERSYEVLAELKAAVSAAGLIVAAGDFNTTTEEVAERNTLDRLVRPVWQLAQDHGCGACPGTFYYAREQRWNWLDTVLWASSASSTVRVLDVRLANAAPEQTRANGTPKAFRLPDADGVSDHWPLVVEFEIETR